jgi:integrase
VQERLRFGDGWGDDPRAEDLVFTDEAGSLLYSGSRSGDRAGPAGSQDQAGGGGAELPQIRLHEARRTHASLLSRAGVPAKVVLERLGHHSAAFTLDVYGHTFP